MPRPSKDIRHEPSLGYEAWRAILASLGDSTVHPPWDELKREQQVAWACMAGFFGAPVNFESTQAEVDAADRGIQQALAIWGVTLV